MTPCRVCTACCDCADLNDLMNVVPFLSPVFCESSNLCRQCWGIREKCKVIESQQIHHCTMHWSPTFLSLFLKSTASLKLLSGGTTFCIGDTTYPHTRNHGNWESVTLQSVIKNMFVYSRLTMSPLATISFSLRISSLSSRISLTLLSCCNNCASY